MEFSRVVQACSRKGGTVGVKGSLRLRESQSANVILEDGRGEAHVVEDEVVIGRDAFEDSKNLWKVTATVTRASEVVDYVFQGCKNLT